VWTPVTPQLQEKLNALCAKKKKSEELCAADRTLQARGGKTVEEQIFLHFTILVGKADKVTIRLQCSITHGTLPLLREV